MNKDKPVPGVASDFWRSSAPEPHRARTRVILAAHPRVRELVGRNPWTAAVAAGVAAFQIAIAAAFGRLGASFWPAAILTAWCVGAFANHCAYVIIHDAAHDLVFRRRSANKALAIFIDLINVVPGAIAFRAYHLQHHAHQGVEDIDADLPSAWEKRLVGRSAMRKALWLFMFPAIQGLRTQRVGAENLRDVWFVANCLANSAFGALLVVACGPMALLYLFASFWFSIGLHPLGGRWIQEHYTLDPAQETASYYGVLNVLALNVGFHNEHHDFPSIPWSRLPAVNRLAPAFYNNLRRHRSWARLVATFILDPRYSLASRVVREPKTREADGALAAVSQASGIGDAPI